LPATRSIANRPTLALLAGASLWGIIWFPMRLLEGGGLTGLWLTLILYATAFLASLPRTASSLREFTRSPGGLGLLMLAAGWTNIAFVEAVLTGNILRVLLLFYLAPLWQVLMGWWFLGERPSRAALLNLLVAMIGAVVMLWDDRVGMPWPTSLADGYALSSGFAFAVSNILVRKMQHVSVQAKSLGVWGGVVCLSVFILVAWRIPSPAASAGVIAGAVALGVFGIMLMTVLVQYGVTHMPVHRSALLALIELVVAAISQQLLTDEVVTVREWIGGALIVTAAWLSARRPSS
jgi:drug/metabolite transporter (DMT)-like permease